MSKKNFPKIVAVSNDGPIPYVTEEMLTAQAGYLISEAGMDNIEQALQMNSHTEQITALQNQLAAEQANLVTANENLTAANTNLQTANNTIAQLTTQLSTAQTDLAAANENARVWMEKAIEFGAKPADLTGAAKPGSDPEEGNDPLSALDELPHNKRADRLLS